VQTIGRKRREIAAATFLQAHWRGAEARTLFQAMTDQEASAIMIQSLWRGYATCTAYKQKRALAITVQSIYRGLSLRREIRFFGACASAIQASWRCYWAKLQYRHDLLDMILVQSVFRRRSAIIQFHMGKAALSVLQSFARMCNALRKIERLRAKNIEYHRRHVATVCLQVSATNSMHCSKVLSTYPISAIHHFDSTSLPCEVI
jgi:myosin heavy subunit